MFYFENTQQKQNSRNSRSSTTSSNSRLNIAGQHTTEGGREGRDADGTDNEEGDGNDGATTQLVSDSVWPEARDEGSKEG